MSNVSRRSFLAASAVSAGLLGLAGCEASSTGETAGEATGDALAAPAADSYPIDPDAEGVEAKWSSEEVRDGWTHYTNPDGGAELGVMDTAKVIQVDGYAFKDMNGNGKLDLYEDWRQSDEDRASALANELTAEEILPLMWNNGFTSTAAPLDDDSVELLNQGMRAGVSRAQASPDNYAGAISWINAVQEWCEANDPHGIPYLNDTDQYQNFSIPDNDGLAASMDMDLIRRAAALQGRTWRATGVRCLLGPQIDIGTNPTWCRYNGSVSEDPALNRDFAKAFISGIQSTWDEDGNDLGWGSDSIIGMAKHYCGAGAVEGGRNDHSDEGKYDVFPGDNFKAHLVPFLDGALNLGTKTQAVASIMPNYGMAYDENLRYGENVGGAYSEVRNGYLRDLAGWDGMLTTDWQISLDSEPGAMMPNRVWGVEELTAAERELKIIQAGNDQIGGEFSVETIKESYAMLEEQVGADEALARIRDSARRIFTCMNHVDLFDQPYSDRTAAAAIFDDQANTDLGVEAAEKSMVMLKNKGGVISSAGLGDKPKVYIPQVLSGGGMFSSTPSTFGLAIDEEVANEYFDVVTDTVGEPTGTSGGGFPGMPAAEDASSEPVYQESDATMPSDEELAQCQYAILIVDSPDGEGGSTTDEAGNTVWQPASLQYRPYTADGDNVRRESIAGNQVESEVGAVWDSTSGGTKENRTYYGQTRTAGNESDLDRVIQVREKLPEDAKLILVVEAKRAMCFHEIEPYADVIFMQFKMSQGVNATALANLITGKTEPSALLPCQQPKDMSEVEGQDEDVPRDMVCYTDSEGNTYDFAFGLNWSGVISDDRTKTYGAEPLTEPETVTIEV